MSKLKSNLNKSLSVVLAGCLIFASMFLAACATQTKKSSSEPTQITLVLDYTPNTNHLGIYVAQAKGYFADKGLEVTIQQPPESGADALVASGEAQFGISFQDWMASYLGTRQRMPVTAVAAIAQHNTSSILSLKSAGIETPKDMTGKTYGTMDVDIEQAILSRLVNDDGGNWRDVKLVSNNAVDEVQGLQSGTYDCVWSYDAWGVLMCKEKGLDVNAISIASLNTTFDYYTPVIIGNDSWMSKNDTATQDFLDALKQGYTFASEHPEEAAKILCEADTSLDLDFVTKSAQEIAPNFLENGVWGVIEPTRWANFFQWINDNELTEREISPYSGFTNNYLKYNV